MEIIFISGLPCSGKTVFAKNLVAEIGHERAVRLPMDHYFLDAETCEQRDVYNGASYQRDRIDWELLYEHLDVLKTGGTIQTPRYDWENIQRVPPDSSIGRSGTIPPRSFVFIDGFQPSMNPEDKHIFVNPSWAFRRKLIDLRSNEMSLVGDYEAFLRCLEKSAYKIAMDWLAENAWRRIENPMSQKDVLSIVEKLS